MFVKVIGFFVVANTLQLVGIEFVVRGLFNSGPLSQHVDEHVEHILMVWDYINLVAEGLAIFVYTAEAIIKAAAYGVCEYATESKLEIFILGLMWLATTENAIRLFVSGGAHGWYALQALQCVRVLRLAQLSGLHAGVRKLYYVVIMSLPQVANLVLW